MTAVSTIIHIKGIAFASDSFLTKKSGQQQLIIESQIGKIIRYEKIRAACVYWGLARSNSWDAKKWLQNKQKVANQKSLPEFADYLAIELQKLQLNYGFGIHLSGYEYVSGSYIPELFLITNYIDQNYNFGKKFTCSRETLKYVVVPKASNILSFNQQRLLVNNYLLQGGYFMFNNGDPYMFNPFANALKDVDHTLKIRSISKQIDERKLLAMAKLPIEMASDAQRELCKKGNRLIGGRIHELFITNRGEYKSNTRD